MYLQHVLALSKNWFHLWVLSLEQPPNNLSPLLEVRDLKGAERGSIQTYEERFTFLPGTSGTSWSLQQHGMFSMTESISWLSPETSERCVRWLNPAQWLLEGGKAAVLENNPDTHLWFVKKNAEGFSLTTFIAFLFFSEADLFPLTWFLSDCFRTNHTILQVSLYIKWKADLTNIP